MKRLLLIFFLVLVNYKIVSAQADLVCSNITITQNATKISEHIFFNFRIKNIGDSLAPTSHTSVYLVNSSNGNDYYLTDVSTESLVPNAESGDYEFVYKLPLSVSVGNVFIKIKANSNNEVVESNTANNALQSTQSIKISPSSGSSMNLPYPVLLLHGFSHNDSAWYNFVKDAIIFYGNTYGGSLAFCLNQDGDVYTSQLGADFKDRTDTNHLIPADFYTLNLDVDTAGNKYKRSAQSNQSALVKQGVAIQKAIAHILKATGSEKVILLGHSMGGISPREYLQNDFNWQSDGKHHVAKLCTLGSPHGGSNATSSFFSNLGVGYYINSEAARDLITTYDSSGDSCVYLFGGVESNDIIRNNDPDGYYNVDVNCNGIIGDTIVGLNQKSIPTDVTYSCIIGRDTTVSGICSNCDGLIDLFSSNLNNFLPQAAADTFICVGKGASIVSGGKSWHQLLLDQTSYIMRGLDEPDDIDKAYSIDLGKYYLGNFTQKNAASISITDSDYYKFHISDTGILTVLLKDIATTQATIKIIDSATNITVATYYTNGRPSIGEFIYNFSPGTYYANVFADPDDKTWRYPYALKIQCTHVISLSGTLRNPNNNAIKYGTVHLFDGNDSLISTDSSGKYRYDFTSVKSGSLKAFKNNDIKKANGVSTIDISLIQSHILKKSLLNSPYKLIAADVNNDKKISSIDITYIKRLILTLDTSFIGNRIWAFLDSAYQFPDSTNPFTYRDSISFNNLLESKTNQSFIGVKLGDVNYDWNPTILGKQSESNQPIEIFYDTVYTHNDSTIKLQLKANHFKEILGMQFTLDFNKPQFDFIGIENNTLGVDYGTTMSNEGKITFLWNDARNEAKTLADGSELFTIVLHKKGNNSTTSDLKLNGDITAIEAYDKNLQFHNIVKGSGAILEKANTTIVQESIHVYPNPTKDFLYLDIPSKKAQSIMVQLIDAKGNTIFNQKQNVQAGMNQLKLNIKLGQAEGVYSLVINGIELKYTEQIIYIK